MPESTVILDGSGADQAGWPIEAAIIDLATVEIILCRAIVVDLSRMRGRRVDRPGGWGGATLSNYAARGNDGRTVRCLHAATGRQ